jgi:hypothetical protein
MLPKYLRSLIAKSFRSGDRGIGWRKPVIAVFALIASFGECIGQYDLVDTTYIPDEQRNFFNLGTVPIGAPSNAGLEVRAAVRFGNFSIETVLLKGFDLGLANTNGADSGEWTISLYTEAIFINFTDSTLRRYPDQLLATLASGSTSELGTTASSLLSISNLSVALPSGAYYLVAGGSGSYQFTASTTTPYDEFGFQLTDQSGDWLDASENTPIYRVSVESVPEPSTYALLGLGAVAWVAWLTRRMRRL